MQMLSEDDLNLRDMTPEELEKAWDLWFTLAQTTNDDDPLYTHGVFTSVTREDLEGPKTPEPALSGFPNAEHAFSEDGVDLTLIRWMLGLTPTERLQAAQDMIDTVWALREACET
jgi:hypothetical protein